MPFGLGCQTPKSAGLSLVSIKSYSKNSHTHGLFGQTIVNRLIHFESKRMKSLVFFEFTNHVIIYAFHRICSDHQEQCQKLELKLLSIPMIAILVNQCKFSIKRKCKIVNNDVIHPRVNLRINMRHLPYKKNNHSSENKKQSSLVILHNEHTFQRNILLNKFYI